MSPRLAVLALAVSLGACSHVTSGMTGSSTSTGEGWYVRNTSFLGIPLYNVVYYCPKETPTRCTSAEMRPYSEQPATRIGPGDLSAASPEQPAAKKLKQFGGACADTADCAKGLACLERRCARP
jgi:hypothetical protein